jgi:hypothetical protein
LRGAYPVFRFSHRESVNIEGRTPPPRRPILRKSTGAISTPLAVNPGTLRQEIRDRTPSLPANSECAQRVLDLASRGPKPQPPRRPRKRGPRSGCRTFSSLN